MSVSAGLGLRLLVQSYRVAQQRDFHKSGKKEGAAECGKRREFQKGERGTPDKCHS